MFKLYINAAGWQKVRTPFYNEQEVAQTMTQLVNKFHTYYFMIIERIDNTDDIKAITRSEEEYIEYLNEVKERYNPKPIDDMSCVDLKKYILDKKGLK